MEELARRREEAARAEAEARERDLADARRVLALPPWLRELVLQKRVLCVSLTPELERVLRRDEERGRGRPDAADLPPSPPPPAIATTTTETPTTATRRTEEDAEGEGSLGAGNGEGERRDEGITKSDENGAGVVKEADLNDVQDSIKEGSRKWVHRFASTGTKTGSDPKPLASSREGFTPFKESACSSSYGRPTAGSSRLLSLSNGFTFEGSGSGGLWNGHLGGGGRSDPLHLSILSVNMGSGATRTHDESRNAKGPQSKGNPFDGSASHLDTPVGEMLRDGADTSTSPGGGWTSLTPAYSTLTRNENGAGVTGSQMRAVTRDGRIQLRCAPPFVLTRRIP